jgi:hypothetical protein
LILLAPSYAPTESGCFTIRRTVLSRCPARVFALPEFRNRVAGLAKPFFIPPQFFQSRCQENFWPLGAG